MNGDLRLSLIFFSLEFRVLGHQVVKLALSVGGQLQLRMRHVASVTVQPRGNVLAVRVHLQLCLSNVFPFPGYLLLLFHSGLISALDVLFQPQPGFAHTFPLFGHLLCVIQTCLMRPLLAVFQLQLCVPQILPVLPQLLCVRHSARVELVLLFLEGVVHLLDLLPFLLECGSAFGCFVLCPSGELLVRNALRLHFLDFCQLLRRPGTQLCDVRVFLGELHMFLLQIRRLGGTLSTAGLRLAL
mmetsp:Transcript_29073/g.49568  ORF Transcript_29073/g.49568 Transcript_29073/m.49568 type:complete len:242 (+) Transcript_29073:375-1100(+)